jgi:hypothetical protein
MLTLDEIVNDYLDENQMPDSKYRRIFNFGIRALRLFHRDSTGFPQTARLTVLANGTAVIPISALNKLAVYVINNSGEQVSLTYDPLLSFYNDTNPERSQEPTVDTEINNEQYVVEFQELQGGLVPLYSYGQFGVGSSGTIGKYNIDWENRVMIFDICFKQPYVWFDFLGLPCTEGGNYLVHPFFQEALIEWLNYRQIKSDKRASLSEKRSAKRDFDVEYANSRKAMDPFDPSDIYNQYRQTIRLSPKV